MSIIKDLQHKLHNKQHEKQNKLTSLSGLCGYVMDIKSVLLHHINCMCGHHYRRKGCMYGFRILHKYYIHICQKNFFQIPCMFCMLVLHFRYMFCMILCPFHYNYYKYPYCFTSVTTSSFDGARM